MSIALDHSATFAMKKALIVEVIIYIYIYIYIQRTDQEPPTECLVEILTLVLN
jgi:hypothetical protein